MEELMTKVTEWVTLYGIKVIAAIAILVIGRLIAKLLRYVIRRTMEKSKVEETIIAFTASVCYVGLMAFVIIAALGQLGVQTASFVAVIGAAGLAIGLALQGSLSNFAAGVLLIIFKPFKVADLIEAGGTLGVVQEIGIFTTQLLTLDNKKVIVPNSKATSDNITNYTAEENRRVDLVVGVSYSEDLNKVKTVVHEVLAANPLVLQDPAPNVAVSELADSSINFVVRPWCKTADYWDVYFGTLENIKKRFDAEEISIPFPQRDVHLFQEAE